MVNREALLKLADWLDAGDLGGKWEFGAWGSTGSCGTSGCAVGLGALAGMLPGVTAKVLGSCMIFEYDVDPHRSHLDGVAAAARAFDIPYQLAYGLFVTVPDEAYTLVDGDPETAVDMTTPQMIANRIRDAVASGR